MLHSVTLEGGGARLVSALVALRGAAQAVRVPLEVPDAAAARAARRELLDHLDGYLLPRLREPDRPLLAVVIGPTGAGKSTLVNSLAEAELTAAGALRPTTRTPVLLCAPGDVDAFAAERVLPANEDGSVTAIRVLPADQFTRGLAVMDAPDVNSVVATNRELSTRLAAVADLWLFVTTANRYADAVPWRLLDEAATRGVAVAVVLNRVPPEREEELSAFVAQMLAERDLGTAPFFTLRETELAKGRIPAEDVAALRRWLADLAADGVAGTELRAQTMRAVLTGIPARAATAAEASRAQAGAADQLRAEALAAYQDAWDACGLAVTDGSLFGDDLATRWEAYAGSSGLTGGADRNATIALEEALAGALYTQVKAAGDAAAGQTAASWRAFPGGGVLLDSAGGDLTVSSPGLEAELGRAVARWRDGVSGLVEGAGARHAEVGPYVPAVLSATLAPEGSGPHQALAAVFTDGPQLVGAATELLKSRVTEVLEQEAWRYTTLVDHLRLEPGAADRLREAAAEVALALGTAVTEESAESDPADADIGEDDGKDPADDSKSSSEAAT